MDGGTGRLAPIPEPDPVVHVNIQPSGVSVSVAVNGEVIVAGPG
jgi:hypothetical protein